MTSMREASTHFESHGRLLLELGERLVASPEVAILELIKNSYDADSPVCRVKLSKDSLQIEDEGNGITEADFLAKWMKIATSSKSDDVLSPKFKRHVTGAKGIGRFAARFLGRELYLETRAINTSTGKLELLKTIFDWSSFDAAKDLAKVKIQYSVQEVASKLGTGTVLKINKLTNIDAATFDERGVRTELLKLLNPVTSLERGQFEAAGSGGAKDPGFKVEMGAPDAEDADISKNVMKNYWARLIIKLENNTLKYDIYISPSLLPGYKRGEKPYFSYTPKNFHPKIKSGLFADIRFFPRRSGLFAGIDIDGRKAASWIKANSGVSVVDHGFRIKPYGYAENDWLKLSLDKAVNKRNEWRSAIVREKFPIPEELKNRPADNPMMYLPRNQQLVGAVFVSSRHSEKYDDDLIPSMDREGFLDNAAFENLEEIVRGGIELLAVQDKKIQGELQEIEAKKLAAQMKNDVSSAIRYVQKLSSISLEDKKRLVTGLSEFNSNLQAIEEYNQKARHNLQTMSLLGVVAGFMTHESDRVVAGLAKSIDKLEKIAKSHPEINKDLEDIKSAYQEFDRHAEYTKTFIKGLQLHKNGSFYVADELKNIFELFQNFTEKRHLDVDIKAEDDTMSPELPISLYSGLIVNLYTNAIKAVLGVDSANYKRKIKLKAWNADETHYVEVHDNGVGIPPSIQARIWDPLFSTTSKLQTPLGTGMGLGLSIVKELVQSIKGSIRLSKPDAGFNTCFRLEIPFSTGAKI